MERMKSNFEFLNQEFPVLSNFGKLAEQYLFSDPNSCLMKVSNPHFKWGFIWNPSGVLY